MKVLLIQRLSQYKASRLFSKGWLPIVLSCFLAGCFPGVYKLNIQQGNILEAEKMDQLKLAMSKRQVRYLLGTPLLVDSFNQDRWHYYYSHKYYKARDSEGTLYEARVVLTFDKNQLVDIDRQIPGAESELESGSEKKVNQEQEEDVPIPEAAEEKLKDKS